MKTNKTEGSRIFRNPVLEALTYTNLPVHILAYLTLSATSVALGYYFFPQALEWVLLTYVAGLFTWSLLEYIMHRFIFHVILEREALKKIYYAFHGVHHEHPREEKRTLMPPLPGALFALLYWCISYIFMGNHAFYFTGGIALGYLLYSSLHHAIHIYKPPKFLQPLWTHHLLHHYQQPERAFGVTSTLWDRIFSTMPHKQKRKTT